jgi:phosphoribosylaminoimidazole-succinocarboxamide synthase
MSAPVMLRSDLPGKVHEGRVRELYDLGGDRLLIVASDRISTYDVVMPTGIPRKGEVLTRLSAFWFARTREVVPNHMLAVLEAGNAAELGAPAEPELVGRSMVVRKAEPLPVECVVRGYITGSGWAEYQRTGSVCGVPLPGGLVRSQQLLEPIFTPTTKAETGHDMPMTFEEVEALVGPEIANAVKLRSLALYRYAAGVAEERGIIIADTKFEFGLIDGEVVLIDEALTPDSSRFWPLEGYEPGHDQPSFDKQYVRDWASSTGWNREPPAPELPSGLVRASSERYLEAYRLLTGEPLPDAP